MVKFAKERDKYILDVRGYVCPYPVIYARKALGKLQQGEILEIITDNPPSCENVPRAIKDDGHTVLAIEQLEEGVWKIVARKGS
jgi:tRNA 2-thiouridine synthesizing protein A